MSTAPTSLVTAICLALTACEASTPTPDASAHSTDASTPTIDARAHSPDASMPDASASPDGGPDAFRVDGGPSGGDITPVPRSLDFGTVPVATSSSPQTVRVTNRGGSALGVFSSAVTGMHAASFTVTSDTCGGATLAPGSACELELVMSPSSPGALSASLDVSAGAAMTSVTLTGTAVTGEPPAFEPAVADFGTWDVGGSSPTTTFTVRNPGAAPTGLASVTIGGANPGDFVIDGSMSTCDGAPLAVFGSCVVVVSFAPVSAGPRSATLRFSATPGGTATAALSGTAP